MGDERQDGRTALQRLIGEIRRERGWSYETIASRAEAQLGRRGDGRAYLLKQQVQKFATGPLTRPPHATTVQGLAAGLGVPIEAVRAAIGESLAYRDSVPGLERGYSQAHALADRLDALSPEARGHLLWTLERAIRAAEMEEAVAGAEDVGQTGLAIFDLIAKLSAAQRRAALAALDEILASGDASDVTNGTNADDDEDD